MKKERRRCCASPEIISADTKSVNKGGILMATVKDVINGWINKTKEWMNTPNHSVYYHNYNVIYSYGIHFPLAVRTQTADMKNEFFVCNGDKYSSTTNKHQSYLLRALGNKAYAIIPFTMLTSAANFEEISFHGDLIQFVQTMKILDRTYDRWIDTNRWDNNGQMIREHILGNTLFDIHGTKLLSGIDAGEHEVGSGRNRRGQYFLTMLKDNVNSISDALESMQPRSVKQALKQKRDVKRQGEWFFIWTGAFECTKLDKKLKTIKDKTKCKNFLIGETVNGRRPHHTASVGIKQGRNTYVKGTIKHTEGDHRPVKLGEWWHKVVRNRQVVSWSIGLHQVD